jgi:hypothetical protein
MNWNLQGSAVVGSLDLSDGRTATVVLVGARSNPKGAALVVSSEGEDASVATVPVSDCLHLLSAKQVVDVFAMQERVFGNNGLNSPFSED